MSNKFVTDPETFLVTFEEFYNKFFKDILIPTTEEWKQRGGDKTIRGSSFAECVRKAYYSFIDPTPIADAEVTEDIKAQKYMALGHIVEEQVGKVLNMFEGQTFSEQNNEPVNIVCPIKDFPVVKKILDNKKVEWRATTDFVKQYKIESEIYYIPIEVKSTGMLTHNWKKHNYHDWHLRQLMYWILYAKAKGWNIPFGVLLYIHRSNGEYKPTIVAVDQPFHKFNRTVINFNHYKPFLEERMVTVAEAIKTKEEPDLGECLADLPSYMCKSCHYLNQCTGNPNQ